MATTPDQSEHFIKELIHKNQDLFDEHDFTECKQVVTDFAEIIANLESTQFKFRRKLSDVADKFPHDIEKVVYLQGMVDGLNLAIVPLKTFVKQ
ncbi:hypothetical protein N0M98_27095 [Paenibacillus doosanensis]|uniref:Uncharacterized protein n=1 Tax=Paenibacillus konkukensis TaxID=2020716 RepID=A0ABY4RV66_9BACL|nr:MULTISPECIES: hypothetical protein [Paenibacillus]MCS7463776.1 hypothetical protein [Paenibacillus doosanensis]UQZ85274.1 hypothetical protein SK3146_04563 [Paenibacillus konkukensis]